MTLDLLSKLYNIGDERGRHVESEEATVLRVAIFSKCAHRKKNEFNKSEYAVINEEFEALDIGLTSIYPPPK